MKELLFDFGSIEQKTCRPPGFGLIKAMPHLIIESSAPIETRIVKKLHAAMASQETVKIGALKTRLYSPTTSLTANLADEAHVAITIKLLPGRSEELKSKMAENILATAQELLDIPTLSVEVIDLGVYKK